MQVWIALIFPAVILLSSNTVGFAQTASIPYAVKVTVKAPAAQQEPLLKAMFMELRKFSDVRTVTEDEGLTVCVTCMPIQTSAKGEAGLTCGLALTVPGSIMLPKELAPKISENVWQALVEREKTLNVIVYSNFYSAAIDQTDWLASSVVADVNTHFLEPARQQADVHRGPTTAPTIPQDFRIESTPVTAPTSATGKVEIAPNSPLGDRIASYAQLVRYRLAQNWATALDLLGKSAPTIVSFHILRDGSIRDPKIVRSSGDPIVDRTALVAVYTTNPLNPLPPQISENDILAEFTFNLR
jgi:TonB family protein